MSQGRKFFAGLVGSLSILLGITLPVFAATAPVATGGGNGLKVSPVRTDLIVKPGESATVDVYVTNVTAQAATFQVVVNDFIASNDETGNPALILDTNQPASAHSLKQFVSPIADVTLKPSEQKDVKVPITIPASAAAGGYYGAVRFVGAGSSTTGNQNVSLSASVGSLILVKVPGNLKEQMGIASFDTRVKDKIHSIFSNGKNIDAVVRFQNTGNVQEQPFGKVTLKNFRGKVLYSGEFNNASTTRTNVLPDSIRKYTIPLKNVGSFGKYTVMGDFGYGNGQTLTATTTFYIIPTFAIVLFVIILLLIVVAIIEVPRMIRSYNKRILRKAGRL